MLYTIFNLLFFLFPLAILSWYEDILNVMSVSFLTSVFIGTFFLIIVLFLFYLYTRLTADKLLAGSYKEVRKNEKSIYSFQNMSSIKTIFNLRL